MAALRRAIRGRAMRGWRASSGGVFVIRHAVSRTLVLTILTVTSGASMAQEKTQSPSAENGGRDLRAHILLTKAGDVGIKPSRECPHVWGVVMDWSVGPATTATVVAMCDGNASLYTTGTFGVLGGIGHESVRRAAMALTRDANRFYAYAKPTTDRSYPKAARVRFYLLAFDGLRVLEDDQSSVESGKNRYSPLFGRAQDVLTELRKIVETRK